jgi:RNA polymerase sigma-70 factor (family 1)
MTQINATDDNALLELMRSGDQQAFAVLYNRYKGVLFIHAYKKLRDWEEVKDIVQEIFSGLWAKRETLEITESLNAYLFRAVRYRIINLISRKQSASVYTDSFQSFLTTYTDNTDHMIREKILCSIIDKEISNLPPKMRHVFELSRKENLTHKEIAEQLGITEQSVRSHVKNALQILRLKLGMFLFVALLLNK